MQLELDPVEVLAVDLGRQHDHLGFPDLAPQIVAKHLSVARRSPVGRAGIEVEEVVDAFEVLEDPQVVVVLLPDVTYEQADRVLLGYAAH